MSINGEQQVFRIAEIRAALNCANSTIYRMIARSEIAVVDTPIGRRITAAEFERLRGGKPLHIVRLPDPKRQAMAAHARSAKAAAKAETAKVAATADELTVFMDEVRRVLPRIEAAVIERLDRIEERITEKWQHGLVEGPGKNPLGTRIDRAHRRLVDLQEIERRPLRRHRKSTSGAAKKVIDGPP